MGAITKVICPNPDHKERTPSCAVYEDQSAYCFGCGSYFKTLSVPGISKRPTEVEDLTKTLAYIDSLPTIALRGLQFPYDAKGYYIVWPSRAYYKRRHWSTSSSGAKYIGATGHNKPLFFISSFNGSRTLIIVEGEINALSIAASYPPQQHLADILSPGGVGNFTDKSTLSYLPQIIKYDSVLIIADSDRVGAEAAIKLKTLIIPYCQDIIIQLMEKDCNQILVEHGKETLKKDLGL